MDTTTEQVDTEKLNMESEQEELKKTEDPEESDNAIEVDDSVELDDDEDDDENDENDEDDEDNAGNDDIKDDLPSILYIVSYRARNKYRKANFKYTMEWLNNVQKYLNDSNKVTFDIFVVEQDAEQKVDTKLYPNVDLLFLENAGLFNKGWSFNCVVKKLSDYDYYAFADADIIVPNITDFCNEVIKYCSGDPVDVFRPFKDRLNTVLGDLESCNNVDEIIEKYGNNSLNLTKHIGLPFAGNMIFVSRQLYNKIGGWDEEFRGWGRYDDFFTYKLLKIGGCKEIMSPLSAIHLWHPITLDFSLRQENISLYDKYMKYTDEELSTLIEENLKNNSNLNKYK